MTTKEPSLSESVTDAARVVCALDARVIRNTALCREHVAIDVLAAGFPPSRPGEFLQLLCRDMEDESARAIEWKEGALPLLHDPEWTQSTAYLRRPFSIADRWETAEGSVLQVISRNVGRGTSWLERLAPGDLLSVTGPLGRGFSLPPPDATVLLVGGGVGIPPLLYTARALHEAGHENVVAIFGATSADLLCVPLISTPAADGTPSRCALLAGEARFPAIITSDDGSAGVRGRVTDGMKAWRRNARADKRPVVLACGPEPMLHAVAELTREWGAACQLCIEKHMGCGLGTCLSCVVRVRDAGRPAGWRWALSCSEGPVFERDVLVEME